jgi:outer membrane protein assembly factor BamE (lipoprotein component of BamABCDE complex)
MKLTRFFVLCALSALLLAACTPTESVHGNLLEDYQIATVKPGTDTQSDVLRKLGSPTTKAPFDDNVWYYLGQDMEKKGILDPKITRERVVVVTFNTDGIVKDVQNVDNHRIPVPYVKEKTPTSGNDITIMQQLLGNLGKFNKAVPGEQP